MASLSHIEIILLDKIFCRLATNLFYQYICFDIQDLFL